MRKVAICVSSEKPDQAALGKLTSQLASAERRQEVQLWHRGRIGGGRVIDSEVAAGLGEAHVIVLLISADLLASREGDEDIQRAMAQRARGALVLPVLVRPVLLSDARFAGLQLLPDGGRRAISQSSDPEADWVAVAQAVLAATPGAGGGQRAAPAQSPTQSSTVELKVAKLLFLAANPSTAEQLKLPDEVRAIDERITFAQKRDRFDLRQEWQVRRKELLPLLLRHKPNILHFSGHGSKTGAIILLDESGAGVRVPAPALTQTFEVVRRARDFDLRFILLNACYSEEQARAIAQHVPCVVGIEGLIQDEAARDFTSGFYSGLADGQSVGLACDLGIAQAAIEERAPGDIIKLFTRPDIDRNTYTLFG